MYCPYKLSNPNLTPESWECEKAYCQAWESKSKFNPKTKEYEGDCRLCMIERKVFGGINTHSY
jgi:hypothetical protein